MSSKLAMAAMLLPLLWLALSLPTIFFIRRWMPMGGWAGC
jgi:hypothetical protein